MYHFLYPTDLEFLGTDIFSSGAGVSGAVSLCHHTWPCKVCHSRVRKFVDLQRNPRKTFKKQAKKKPVANCQILSPFIIFLFLL